MKRATTALGMLLLTSLAGCVGYDYGAPAPYYGGVAPYYGTTYVPAYAYASGHSGGGYYPYHRSANIYSGYNKSYWHYQRGAAQRPAAAASHAAPHGGEQHR